MSRFTKPIQLEQGVGLEGFHCGSSVVDSWAEHYAATARKRGTAVVYALYCGSVVAGFYTLSTHSVSRADVHGGWFVRNAHESVPAVLLGMLGVDERFKGCGLGASLLRDAVQNAMKVASLAGARALIVDPVDDSAVAFYKHFGFSKLQGTKRMALRIG